MKKNTQKETVLSLADVTISSTGHKKAHNIK